MDFDYRLLAKYLTGMLSPEEMKQVEEWRKLSIDNEEVFSEFIRGKTKNHNGDSYGRGLGGR